MSRIGPPKRIYGCGDHGTFIEQHSGSERKSYRAWCTKCNPTPGGEVTPTPAQREAKRLYRQGAK